MLEKRSKHCYIRFGFPRLFENSRFYKEELVFHLDHNIEHLRRLIYMMRTESGIDEEFTISGPVNHKISKLLSDWKEFTYKHGAPTKVIYKNAIFDLSFGKFQVDMLYVYRPFIESYEPMNSYDLLNIDKNCDRFIKINIACMGSVVKIGD